MELAAAAMSAIGSAISSVTSAGAAVVGSETAASAAAAIGKTVTSAGAGAGWLSGSGSMISSILQGSAGLLSVVGAIGKGNADSDALKSKAADAGTEIQLEQIKGDERRNTLRRQLADALAERDVAAAASGVDLSFGTASQARTEALQEGNRALAADQSTQDLRISRLQERQAELLLGAKQARRAGLIKAFGSGAGTAAQIFNRG